ncbi:transcription factor 25 [Plasmodium brasilianum]|uniref:Transcription factor 25 n=1 Tax=Plasmodium brasilianum TaxID=5824 RepID=A0ACB9YE25_PLABR|nr:transcription factor 25 [Plasmodium brasilianum]
MSSRLLKKILKEKNRDEINKIKEIVEAEALSFKPKKKKHSFKFLEDSQDDDGDDDTSESTNGEEGDGRKEKKTKDDIDGKKRSKDEDANLSDEEKCYSCVNSSNKHGKVKNGNNKAAGKEVIKKVEEKKVPLLAEEDISKRGKKCKKKKKKKNMDEEISSILNKINEEDGEEEKKEKEQGDMEHSLDPSEYNNNKPSYLYLFACTHEKYEYCLKLEKNNFNVNVELKRIFGKDFIKDKKFIKKSKIKYLKNWLVQDYTTKTIQPPLIMKFDENQFKLEKLKLYLEAENLFYVLLDSHDIQAMNDLLKKYPFHIDTLLILSEYYNETSNFEIANKFIKMSLLLLQNIFHINFNPNFLNKYNHVFVNPFHYDNKALFKSLYMHMLYLENEACTITSLEVAKLLCKIDLRYDLCSTLLRMDNLILKCNLFDFLIYFSFNFVLQNVECVIPPNRFNEIIDPFLAQQHSSLTMSIHKNGKINDHRQDDICNSYDKVDYTYGSSNMAGIIDEKDNPNMEGRFTQVELEKRLHCEAPEAEAILRNEKLEQNMENKNYTTKAGSKEGSTFADISTQKGDINTASCSANVENEVNKVSNGENKVDSTYTSNTVNIANKDNCLSNKTNGALGSSPFDNFEIRLHLILPNFAFSVALCLYLKNNSYVDYNQIKLISKNDIINSFSYKECKYMKFHFNINFNCYNSVGSSCNEGDLFSISFCAHLFLIRALLCYPTFLHLFLNFNNFKSKVVKQTIYDNLTFNDILANPPFSNSTLFSAEEYESVQKIISCYLEKNNIYYKSERIITWFHVCCSFIHELYKDTEASQEVEAARKDWRKKIPLLDIKKYKDVRVGEFKSRNYLLPDFMMEKNRAYSTNIPSVTSNYYVSLNSNLLIAFFQSLLPWYQVDYYENEGEKSEDTFFYDHDKISISEWCAFLRSLCRSSDEKPFPRTHSRPVYLSTFLRTIINETKRLFNFS